MSLSINLWTHALNPMLAEVRLQVQWRGPTPGQLRGRLMGPKCPRVTTIEVAYPLHVLETTTLPICDPTDPDALVQQEWLAQALIPEPCLWDAQTPFVYEGPMEVWRDDLLLAREVVSIGLKKP